jgi:hypothetical protein
MLLISGHLVVFCMNAIQEGPLLWVENLHS